MSYCGLDHNKMYRLYHHNRLPGPARIKLMDQTCELWHDQLIKTPAAFTGEQAQMDHALIGRRWDSHLAAFHG